MSRFLFTTLPTNDFGLLTRSLPIAFELKNRGHEIAFCHPARGPQILIAEAGFINLKSEDPMHYLGADYSLQGFMRLLAKGKPLQTLNAIASMAKIAMRFNGEIWNIDHFSAMEASYTGIFHARVAAMTKLIESFQADVVVDFWNLVSCIAVRVLKKPLITIIQSQMHPQSPGFIWWKKAPSDIPTAVPIMNQVLNRYGLPTVKNAGDLFLGDLTLIVGIPELDPLPDTGGGIYLGPLLWQKPNAVDPKWFAELRSDKPVVWVYTGKLRYAGSSRTAMDSEIVLHACLEALRGEDIQVVLTTGYNDLPRPCLPLPTNFRFEPFVPGLAMAKRSNLIIQYGSCQTWAYVGTPAVIIPTMSERESNARRLQEQGAAEILLPASDSTGKKKRIDSRKLAASVNKVLFTPSYKENAERLRTKLLEHGGPSEAARLIEEELKNHRHPSFGR